MPISCTDAARYVRQGLGNVNRIGSTGVTSRGQPPGGGLSVWVDETLIQISFVNNFIDGKTSEGEWMFYRNTRSGFANVPFARSQGQPQKTLVSKEELERFRGIIQDMLKAKQCRDFVHSVLEEVKAQTGRGYSDILTRFDQIRFYWGPTGPFGGSAYWENGVPAATIDDTIKTEKPSGSLANQQDRRSFLISQTAQGLLAETLHHVATGGRTYSDPQMANAVNAVLLRSGLDKEKTFSEDDYVNASIYWHPKVWSKCPIPRK